MFNAARKKCKPQARFAIIIFFKNLDVKIASVTVRLG